MSSWKLRGAEMLKLKNSPAVVKEAWLCQSGHVLLIHVDMTAMLRCSVMVYTDKQYIYFIYPWLRMPTVVPEVIYGFMKSIDICLVKIWVTET